MYQQFYSDGLFLHFPLIATLVFVTAFAGVVVWALWLAPKETQKAQLDRLAALPLGHDAEVNHE